MDTLVQERFKSFAILNSFLDWKRPEKIDLVLEDHFGKVVLVTIATNDYFEYMKEF